jgi:excisionase family DNA binding protein
MAQNPFANAYQVSPRPQERDGFSVREVAGRYGVSEPFVRLEIQRGNLRASKLGRRVVIPIDCVEEWVTDGMLFPEPRRRPRVRWK